MAELIRLAKPEDAPMLAFMHASCFPVHQLWDTRAFENLLVLPTTRAYLVEGDVIPHGFILYQVVPDEAEILSIGILPEARNAGTGNYILQRTLNLLREQGVRQVFLEVSPVNNSALGLYKKNGFRTLRTRKGYYTRPDGTKEDALVLAKQLP